MSDGRAARYGQGFRLTLVDLEGCIQAADPQRVAHDRLQTEEPEEPPCLGDLLMKAGKAAQQRAGGEVHPLEVQQDLHVPQLDEPHQARAELRGFRIVVLHLRAEALDDDHLAHGPDQQSRPELEFPLRNRLPACRVDMVGTPDRCMRPV